MTVACAALPIKGTITVGGDDAGHDVKFFGAAAGAYMLYDFSCDQLEIRGASADAATSTGKLLLTTALTNINANDVLGSSNFQAPVEAGGCDAILIAAGIRAVAQATFTCAVNATALIFYTGHSEAAAERFRFTSQNEIGVAGANYGTDGQVLTSGGAGAAVAWEDAGGGGPSQANQTAIEAETNQDTYIPPDLIKHSPGVAKAHGHHAGSGSLASNSYNLDSTAKDSTGVYTWTFTTDFSAATYAVAGTDTSTVCAVHSDGSGKATGEWVERCYDSNTDETFADGGYDAAFYGDQ